MKTIQANFRKQKSFYSTKNFVKNWKDYTYSPTFIFINALKLKNKDCGNGISLDYAFQVMETNGNILERDVKYVGPEDDICCRQIDMPDSIVKNIAKKSQIWMRDMWNEKSNEKICNSIKNGIPVGFEMIIPGNFYEQGLNKSNTKQWVVDLSYLTDIKFIPGKPSKTHSMVIVGFNPSKRIYKVANSYGKEWGNEGYFYIPFALFSNIPNERSSFHVPDIAIKLGVIIESDPRRRVVELENLQPDTNYSVYNILNNYFKNTYWISKGKYIEFGDLKLGCTDLDYVNKKTFMALMDSETGQLVTNFVLTGNSKWTGSSLDYLITIEQQDNFSKPRLNDWPIESNQIITIIRRPTNLSDIFKSFIE